MKENKNLITKRDWEHDGQLRMENAQTIKRYCELKEEVYNTPLNDFDLFCAFTEEQFQEGKQTISPLEPGEKYVSCGTGIFGRRAGAIAYLNFCDEIDKRIAEECVPQEVYNYEYNNHECCISLDGDHAAILIIHDLWGWDVCRQIKRYSACETIDELIAEYA